MGNWDGREGRLWRRGRVSGNTSERGNGALPHGPSNRASLRLYTSPT